MTAHQQRVYKRALDRGCGFLILGLAFASPVIGSHAGRGIGVLLGLAGYRYGLHLEPY